MVLELLNKARTANTVTVARVREVLNAELAFQITAHYVQMALIGDHGRMLVANTTLLDYHRETATPWHLLHLGLGLLTSSVLTVDAELATKVITPNKYFSVARAPRLLFFLCWLLLVGDLVVKTGAATV